MSDFLTDNILRKLRELESLINNSKKIPFSNNRMIEVEPITQSLDEIIQSIPESIKQANKIVENEKRIVDGASKYALETKDRAKNMADNLINEIKQRKEEAESKHQQIINDANNKANLIIKQANEQVEQIKKQGEKEIEKANEVANEIIKQAEQYCIEIKQQAERDAKMLVSQEAILTQATHEAQIIKDQANEYRDNVYMSSKEHIEQVLNDLEKILLNKSSSIRMLKGQIFGASENNTNTDFDDFID